MAAFKAANLRGSAHNIHRSLSVNVCSDGGCRDGCSRPRLARVVLLLLLLLHYARQQWLLAGRVIKAESDDAEATKSQESFRVGSETRTDPSTSLISPWMVRKQQEPADESNPINPIRGAARRQQTFLKILYMGEFGLGHRLSKMSAAYHLVHMMIHSNQQPRGRDIATTSRGMAGGDAAFDGLELEASWGACEWGNGTKIEIFSSLFGPEPLLASPLVATSLSASRNRHHDGVLFAHSDRSTPNTILIRNDVKGYYAGQMYKNAKLPITSDLVEAWDDKMHTTDLLLFHQLFDRFRFRDIATQYQRERQWDDHVVVGIHFRLGNGEQDHFAASKRAVDDAHRLVQQSLRLVLRYRDEVLSSSSGSSSESSYQKPWAIFVASDTPSVTALVQDALGRFQPRASAGPSGSAMKLWSSPSLSHTPERGVSYTITDSDECTDGWKFAMIDQYLLSHVQVLVAPTRSTFTQILPRAMVMSTPHPHPTPTIDESHTSGTIGGPSSSPVGGGTFCEIEFDESACPPRMSCYINSLSWLLRRNATSHIVAVEEDVESPGSAVACRSASGEHTNSSYKPHKVLVHLPETVNQWADAKDEWRTLAMNAPLSSRGGPARYGERIAQKYRRYAFHPEWSIGR